MGLLADVRQAAAATAAEARLVRVDRAVIAAYAATLPLEHAGTPQLDAETHYVGEREATLAYVVTLDAINFGSGYFPHLHKRPGMSGYFTMASSLRDVWMERGPLSAEELQRLTQADCARIFGQTNHDDAVAQELMALFAQALNAVGALLAKRYDGSFDGLVAAADGSAERLAQLLTAMPFYQDHGFYKRAQLTAADLNTAGVAAFDDLDQLTMFADNLVPHVLRLDGVLVYDPELVERIERQEVIAAGSREEHEIRAGALHAVELLAQAARDQSRPVTSMQLDYVLWNRGQQPAYKARPRHRTRTVFY
ncbi:MAG TPA: queuosine salvage family protein [Chloroflexota bacterium]